VYVKKKWLLLCATALMVLVGMTACQPREEKLPFETIERLDASGTGELWEAKESGLMVIAAPEDLAQIDDLFTKDAQAQLHKVDFDTHFAVTVFLGWQPDSHEGVQIDRVVRRRDRIAVYAQGGKPGPEPVETSPYHLVKVEKKGNWNRAIHFTLYMDGTQAMSLSHFIP
jgi:hypothetical protein